MNPYGQRLTQPGEDFRAADRLEIMDVFWRFMMSIDIGDKETFADCFTPTVLWDLSNNPVRFTGGAADLGPTEFERADFVERAFGAAGQTPSRERFMQHCVNNPLITFTGADSGTVLAHLRNPTHTKVTGDDGQQHPSDRTLGGLYHLDVRQLAGRWRISALRLSVYAYDPATMVGRG
jgi:hypothetical protein